jgi:hypothetical protein
MATMSGHEASVGLDVEASNQEAFKGGGAKGEQSLIVLASDLVVDPRSFGLTSTHSSVHEVPDSDFEDCAGGRGGDDDFSDLEQLEVLRREGFDVKGRQIVRIVGKFLPAPVIDGGRLKAYVLQKLQQELQPGPFVIMYFHTAVQRNDNSPGMRTLRDIYESLPIVMKQRLESVYILHPGLRSRLLIATLGRFFLSEGFYSKVVYINRLEFLVDYVKKGQVEIPEFVFEHDKELELRPLMDYGLEVDPLQYNDMPLGSSYPRHSLR